MLKEQFIHRLNNETIIAKIIKELIITLKYTSEVISEQGLMWAQRVGSAQSTESSVRQYGMSSHNFQCMLTCGYIQISSLKPKVSQCSSMRP